MKANGDAGVGPGEDLLALSLAFAVAAGAAVELVATEAAGDEVEETKENAAEDEEGFGVVTDNEMEND